MTKSADFPLRVGIWCAVSSAPQAADDKISLPDQEASGRQFAEAIGGVVARIYSVPGHTRNIILWSDAEREMDAYRQLRQDLDAGHIDILYAIDIDRLGRTISLGQQVIDLVEKSGGEVYFTANLHIIGLPAQASRRPMCYADVHSHG